MEDPWSSVAITPTLQIIVSLRSRGLMSILCRIHEVQVTTLLRTGQYQRKRNVVPGACAHHTLKNLLASSLRK